MVGGIDGPGVIVGVFRGEVFVIISSHVVVFRLGDDLVSLYYYGALL